MGFSGSSEGKESACNAGDLGSIAKSGRSFREENGNPLQYSCLENSKVGGAWRGTVHRVTKIQIRLSHSHTHTHSVLTTSISTSWELVRYAEFWILTLLFGVPRWLSG